MKDKIDRSAIPQADHFKVYTCTDPDCGPHVVALDEKGKPICEIVIARKNVGGFCTALLDIVEG